MSYFWSGLWHLAAAMAFALAFAAWGHGQPLYFLHFPAFSFALVVSSAAFFWVPDRWAKRGLWKFLHYPLPDWDVLLLGPASHRNWLTHSPILPAMLLGALWHWPSLASPLFYQFALGSAVGTGSHLFWDCVGSKRHSVVVVPYWWTLREASSRLYLLTGAVICLTMGGVLCGGFEPLHPASSNPGLKSGANTASRNCSPARTWQLQHLQPHLTDDDSRCSRRRTVPRSGVSPGF